jgi:subtilisin family serine protease
VADNERVMLHGIRFKRLCRWSLGLAVASLSLAPSGASGLASTPQGPLSPVLAQLAKPSVVASGPAAQANAVGVPDGGPAALLREGKRVVVTSRFDRGAVAALPDLRSAGAEIVSTGADRQTVTLAVMPEDLDAVAAVPGVKAVWEQREPIAYGVGEGTCEGGAVVSEGLGQLRVDDAREALDLLGQDQTVGVLSDSYNRDTSAATHAPGDVASGDLTGAANPCADQNMAVDVLAEGPSNGADEGRAMLQIVHDLVPQAKLAFATAFQSEESFAQNIERLARPVSAGGGGADVIVDDVAWFEEPFFQDGPIAAAVNKVNSEGVSYFSAAGNDNLFEGSNDIASWEAPEFRDAGTCPTAVGLTETNCMDFMPGAGIDNAYGLTLEPGAELTLDLQWDEPWFGVEADLDAFLLDKTGKILAESTRDNISGGKPVELISWKNESSSEPKEVQLVINRCVATCNPEASLTAKPRLKLVLLENGRGVESVEYPVSSGGDLVGPTIFGHAGTAAAMSVGAIPYNSEFAPEPYSSRGPVRHDYGPVQGTTPAPQLSSPEIVHKPDFVATDCGATTFFAFLSGGTWRFCGTSAAAPHAAAVAALILERAPGLAPAEVRSRLAGTARSIGGFGADAVGSGLLDAMAALEATPGKVIEQNGIQPLPIEVAPDIQTATPYSPPTTPSSRHSNPGAAGPQTKILEHPPKVVRRRRSRARVVFRFGSDQRGATFLCKVDRSPFAPCRARFVRRLALGPHVLKVKARGVGGLTDPTPAVFRFRIERR